MVRETAVLIAVFGMLDKILRLEGATPGWTVAVLGVALFFFVFASRSSDGVAMAGEYTYLFGR